MPSDFGDVPLSEGLNIWIKDKDQKWVQGQVQQVTPKDKPREATVQVEHGTVTIKKTDQVHLQEPSKQHYEDMTDLIYLNEPNVVWNLSSRYYQDYIYTYTGNILISLNPFFPLPHLYDQTMMDNYYDLEDLKELEPHVYAIANVAYMNMRRNKQGQAILVSGESGAGKTETSKHIMSYLAYIGAKGSQTLAQQDFNVEEKILKSNPLLEAFGNTKTIRNNNSSRFGKFIEIQFGKNGRITGAAIKTYLLERSRIIGASKGERCYHIFYQLCDGASEQEKKQYHLQPMEQYHYLNQSDCYDLPFTTNTEEFRNTRDAMEIIGILEDDQDQMFRIISAVLNVGNINFSQNENDEAFVQDDKSKQFLQWSASLLGVDAEKLERVLTTSTIIVKNETIIKPLDAQASRDTRDSLAKSLYTNLFNWLVERLNNSIGQDPQVYSTIGVLDIYGFESFDFNDFEQFCINLTNEKLQQHFNKHVFKQEQNEYEKEQINWSYINFTDNQEVLDLIETKNQGIVDLLDELCRFKNTKPEDLVSKVYDNPSLRDNKRLIRQKLQGKTNISIDHYAGKVDYDVRNFIIKNQDFTIPEHRELLSESSSRFISQLFTEIETERNLQSSKGKQFTSLGARFRQQLQELMTTLEKMEPYYVRCIKPNDTLKQQEFTVSKVVEQLKCNGVMEAIRISLEGYSAKRPYADFLSHFGIINMGSYYDFLGSKAMETEENVEGMMQLTQDIIGRAEIPKEAFQLGVRKVFIKGSYLAKLEKLRQEKLTGSVVNIQKNYKRHYQKNLYIKMRTSIIVFQVLVRQNKSINDLKYLKLTVSATITQTLYRSKVLNVRFSSLREAANIFQGSYRAKEARKQNKKLSQLKSAIVIQKSIRRRVAYRSLQNNKHSVDVIKSVYNIRKPRQELRRLRANARESGKLMQDKQMLEKRVKELDKILETVQDQRNELKSQLKQERADLKHVRADIETVKTEYQKQMEDAEQYHKRQSKQLQDDNQKIKDELKSLKSNLDSEIEATKKSLEKSTNENKSYQTQLQKLQQDLQTKQKQFDQQYNDMAKKLKKSTEQGDEMNENYIVQIEQNKDLQKQVDKQKQVVMELQTKLKQSFQQGERRINVNQEQQTQSKQLPSVQQFPPSPQLPPPSPQVPNNQRRKDQDILQDPAIMSYSQGPQSTRRNSIDKVANVLWRKSRGSQYGRTNQQSQEGIKASPSQTSLESQQNQYEQDMYGNLQKEQVFVLNLVEKNNLGFVNRSPVAAQLIFRTCLQYRVFQDEQTQYLSLVLKSIQTSVERKINDKGHLAYWLSNSSVLLYLVNTHIKPVSRVAPQSRNAQRNNKFFSNLQSGLFNYNNSNQSRQQQQQFPQQNHGQASSTTPSYKQALLVRQQQQEPEKQMQQGLKESPRNMQAQQAQQQFLQQFQNESQIYGAQGMKKTGSNANLVQQALNQGGMRKMGSNANLNQQGQQQKQGGGMRKINVNLNQQGQGQNVGGTGMIKVGSNANLSQQGGTPRYNQNESQSMEVRTVDATYKALLFKQQIDSNVEKIYVLLRASFRKDLTPLINTCSLPKKQAGRRRSITYGAGKQRDNSSQYAWKNLLARIRSYEAMIQENYLPPIISKSLFAQTFQFINTQIFNCLVLKRESCTLSNGQQLKAGLDEFQNFLQGAQGLLSGLLDQMKQTRQAVEFIITQNKLKRTLKEITDLCPDLTMQQIYRLGIVFSDDMYNAEALSDDVLFQMKQQIKQEQQIQKSYLIDDDIQVPFSKQVIKLDLQDTELYCSLPTTFQGQDYSNLEYLKQDMRLMIA